MGEFSKYIFICSQSPFILIHPQLDKLTLFFKEQTWVDRKYETLIMLNQVTAAMQLAYSLYLGGGGPPSPLLHERTHPSKVLSDRLVNKGVKEIYFDEHKQAFSTISIIYIIKCYVKCRTWIVI